MERRGVTDEQKMSYRLREQGDRMERISKSNKQEWKVNRRGKIDKEIHSTSQQSCYARYDKHTE